MIEELGKGSFCVAYLAIHVKKKAPKGTLCIKVEKTNENRRHRQLHREAKLYEMLSNEKGFPRAHHFGEESTYNFLAMDALGPNLGELLHANGGTFSVKCICTMAIQMLTRIESLHKHDFIHRDIKPANFLVGRGRKASQIYLCDLGLCKKYRSILTRTHMDYQTNRPLAGTPRYEKASNMYKNLISFIKMYK